MLSFTPRKCCVVLVSLVIYRVAYLRLPQGPCLFATLPQTATPLPAHRFAFSGNVLQVESCNIFCSWLLSPSIIPSGPSTWWQVPDLHSFNGQIINILLYGRTPSCCIHASVNGHLSVSPWFLRTVLL